MTTTSVELKSELESKYSFEGLSSKTMSANDISSNNISSIEYEETNESSLNDLLKEGGTLLLFDCQVCHSVYHAETFFDFTSPDILIKIPALKNFKIIRMIVVSSMLDYKHIKSKLEELNIKDYYLIIVDYNLNKKMYLKQAIQEYIEKEKELKNELTTVTAVLTKSPGDIDGDLIEASGLLSFLGISKDKQIPFLNIRDLGITKSKLIEMPNTVDNKSERSKHLCFERQIGEDCGIPLSTEKMIPGDIMSRARLLSEEEDVVKMHILFNMPEGEERRVSIPEATTFLNKTLLIPLDIRNENVPLMLLITSIVASSSIQESKYDEVVFLLNTDTEKFVEKQCINYLVKDGLEKSGVRKVTLVDVEEVHDDEGGYEIEKWIFKTKNTKAKRTVRIIFF